MNLEQVEEELADSRIFEPADSLVDNMRAIPIEQMREALGPFGKKKIALSMIGKIMAKLGWERVTLSDALGGGTAYRPMPLGPWLWFAGDQEEVAETGQYNLAKATSLAIALDGATRHCEPGKTTSIQFAYARCFQHRLPGEPEDADPRFAEVSSYHTLEFSPGMPISINRGSDEMSPKNDFEAKDGPTDAAIKDDALFGGERYSTCGTRHLTAERAVRIFERMSHWDGIDGDAVQVIIAECDQAGPTLALHALKKDEKGPEVPW